MSVIEQVDAHLNEALGTLRTEYEEWKSQRDQEDAAFQMRMQAIGSIIEGNGNGNGTAPKRSSAPVADKDTELSISDERLNMILRYMRSHPKARQADITKDLGFNSGTVSVGLRKLQTNGQVEPGSTERGSRVWNFQRVPAHA